ELVPHLFAELGARVLADSVLDDLGEVLLLPVTAGEADQAEPRRQQPPVGQVIDGRHDLLAGEVTGDTEADHAARPGDPGQPSIARITQWIGLCSAVQDRCHVSASIRVLNRAGWLRWSRSTGRPRPPRT